MVFRARTLNSTTLQPFGRNQSSLQRSPLIKDVGDSIGDALDLGRFTRNSRASRRGEVDRNDPDFYEFRLQKKSNLTLRLVNNEQDDESFFGAVLNNRGRVALVNRQRLIREVESGRSAILTASLEPGTYYLRFSTLGQNVDFEFRLTTI